MTHQPSRFQVFTQLSDGSGFKIPNCDFVFVFDSHGGWFDQQRNYYNQDGDPETPPSSDNQSGEESEDEDSYSQHSDDDFYQDIVNQYKYDHDPEEQDQLNTQQDLKNLQKITYNEQILSNYPSQKALRVYYQNMNYNLQSNQIKTAYEKHANILRVVPAIYQGKFNGRGYFVMPNKQQAKKLIELEGKNVAGRVVYFRVQTIDQLVIDPLDKQLISGSQDVWNIQSSAKQKYKQKKSEQATQKLTQAPKQPQPKQQAPSSTSQTFSTYSFELPLFQKPQNFKAWMKTFGLQINKHYKGMKLKTKMQDGAVYGTVLILESQLSKCNKQEYNNKEVLFTKIQN